MASLIRAVVQPGVRVLPPTIHPTSIPWWFTFPLRFYM